jgi:outer membrane lipoprotein SlyB
MVQKLSVLFLIIALLISGFGCATTSDGTPSTVGSTATGALGGAATGAGLGALIGLATGNVAHGAAYGAIAGAATGAVVGFIYAKHQEQMLRDRQAAESTYKYQPAQGERAILESVNVTPTSTSQGGQVDLNSDYTVLNGSDQPMPVDLTQSISYQGTSMGTTSNKLEKKSGTYKMTVPATIPANAPEGRYVLVTKLQTPSARDEKSCEFQVGKKMASGEREIRLVSVNGVPVKNF